MADDAIQQIKCCTKCGEAKPLSEYGRNSAKKDGLKNWCKDCACQYSKIYHQKNRDRILPRLKEYAEKNRDYFRVYYKRNSERYAQHSAGWRKKNPEKYKQSCRLTHLRKMENPQKRIEASVRAGVQKTIRKERKGARTFKILGYSVEELMAHLERQFLRGMTWGNYGQWHVDHIVPLASFNYSSPDDEDFKAAWALTNLRPLWKVENISKGAKRLTLL